MIYKKDAPFLRFAPSSTRIFVLGGVLLLLSAISYGIKHLISVVNTSVAIINAVLVTAVQWLDSAFVFLLIIGIATVIIAIAVNCLQPDSSRIRCIVRRALFDYSYGNPLHFKEGELLPSIKCKKSGLHKFVITITTKCKTAKELQDISPSISSCLDTKGFWQYAVVETTADLAFKWVSFTIENVMIQKVLVIDSIEELRPKEPTKLIVQKGTYIDLTTSGSMLIAGKTRSGKTTGIIALLLQVLLAGRDKFGSLVTIIDPKKAELSQLPHTYTLDENGEATPILDAIKNFAATITKRQEILNDLSVKSGDAVKWWDADMRASFLFIDEYVSLRSILPKRTAKDSTDYNIETFDGLIKRIVTMGASAGCYVIISIAEASVGEGGLPGMLQSAMTTRVLFKPKVKEGRFMWDSDMLKDFPERTYNAGQCWFSSTDGIHDNVTYAQFPNMGGIKLYAELHKLLKAYYRE
ncbi:MAG: FtsK/SpoIIIE domain-containing protein [Defluviitaleaceae bacterium]|nr:FtsK/SpoIIIE domain-containing protein [Defluviitaleaceae bacterium]